MISHICFVNSLSQYSRQNPMDLYSMCVVFFYQVNIQIQNYFIDQKYQYLKSKPLAKDSEKQKTFEDVKYQKNNQKGLRKRDIAKQKNSQKWKSAANKRKSEYTQSEKSQNQTTADQKKRDNKQSLLQMRYCKEKLNWKRGKNNIKAEKIFKRYVH